VGERGGIGFHTALRQKLRRQFRHGDVVLLLDPPQQVIAMRFEFGVSAPTQRLGTSPPRSRRAVIRLMTNEGDTLKCAAVARREWPASTYAATRSRRSIESGLGIANHLPVEVNHAKAKKESHPIQPECPMLWPQSQTADTLLQSIDLAVAAEALGADGAYFRVHHFAGVVTRTWLWPNESQKDSARVQAAVACPPVLQRFPSEEAEPHAG
jgi:hypothetical protein